MRPSEMMTVHRTNRTEFVNKVGGHSAELLMLNLAVSIVATGLQRVK